MKPGPWIRWAWEILIPFSKLGKKKVFCLWKLSLHNKNHKLKFFQGSKQVINEKGLVRARLASVAHAQVEMSNCSLAPADGYVKLSWLYPDRLLLFFSRKTENTIFFPKLNCELFWFLNVHWKNVNTLPSKINHFQVQYGALRLPVYGTCFIGNMHNLRNLEPIFAKIWFWIKRKKRISLPQEVCLSSRIDYYLL